MLFLLNEQIVAIDAPELHLNKCWRSLGCGDPYGLRARDALDYAASVMESHLKEGVGLDEGLVRDLASLIIAKTGANAVLFPVFETALGEPRLTILPEAILQALKDRYEEEGSFDLKEVWPLAA